MKKQYLKKIGSFATFSVWIVDGEFVRKNIDKEFTNFGQHFRFSFIPKNEFWIDKPYSGRVEEELFFIDHLIKEFYFMEKGKTYNFSSEKAIEFEMKERKKSVFYKRLKSQSHKKLLSIIHKRLVKNIDGLVKVWVVNGEAVRDLFYIDFTEGGHDIVYDFIPSKEVWIDDDVSSQERKFIILHELYERGLMLQGKEYRKIVHIKGKRVMPAHWCASEVEWKARKNPALYEELLKKAINLNK